ncbi:spore germination protein [Paenibacillus lautus]|uniref:spore germination protein n=1 Tax=Paenibacillus lautus TaxID=1401 RepID=UPI002DBA6245|nr:spore germination protein [Paenibacillus lautus]MEC0206952.1 spore germination protein [Paenibacillus lautus]
MPFWKSRYSHKGNMSNKEIKPKNDKKFKKKTSKLTDGQPKNTRDKEHMAMESSLEARLNWYQDQLKASSDIIYREFSLSSGHKCTLIYVRAMVSQTSIQDFIIKSLQEAADEQTHGDIYQYLFEDNGLSVSSSTVIRDLNKGLKAIFEEGALLLIDGDERMMSLSISSYPKRSIVEAPNESVIRGPREAFIEDLETNIALMRKRIKSKDFKTEAVIIGERTQTEVVIAYIEGICKPDVLNEVKRRLSYIEIDGVLESSFLEEAIEDNPYSPFPQIQYSERPDVITAAMLEGRVSIFVDGTPITLIVPVTLFMLLQSAEDYYQRFVAATWIRWIRYALLSISLLLPSLYIAITTFHPEMIPSQLLLTLAAARETVPFPALLEAFMMEIAFEALREASVRIPKSIGQAVSIIGALVIGTAAVQAGIVSAAMVIIVSLTGIASFIIPSFDLGLAFRLLRFPVMLLASIFGLFGIAVGIILIYIHLVSLKSFGQPYLSPIAPWVSEDIADTLIRVPWWKMHKRPVYATNNITRQKSNSRGWEKEKSDLK